MNTTRRSSIAGLALIWRMRAGQKQWLARWNSKWKHYHFVGGHKEPGESFRDCVVREVQEELALREGTDFFVARERVARMNFTAVSKSALVETAYTMELFEVQLTSDKGRLAVDVDSCNRWLSETEIRTRLCCNGKPIAATMATLLRELGEIESCEGDC